MCLVFRPILPKKRTEGTTNYLSKGLRQNITLVIKAEDFLFVLEITRNPDKIERLFNQKA